MSSRRQSYANHQGLLEAIGRSLYAHRLRVGLSQEEVSSRTGIPRTGLSGIEQGKRTVDAVELILLAMLYGRTVDELLPERHHWPEPASP